MPWLQPSFVPFTDQDWQEARTASESLERWIEVTPNGRGSKKGVQNGTLANGNKD